MANEPESISYINLCDDINHPIDAVTIGEKSASDLLNKDGLVTSINGSSDDSHYPSAKCIYDIIYGSGGSPTPPSPSHNYAYDYLTYVMLEDNGTFSLDRNDVYVSTDNGETWKLYSSPISGLSEGDRVMIKSDSNWDYSEYGGYIGAFDCNVNHNIEGNIMSIYDSVNFRNMTDFDNSRYNVNVFNCLFAGDVKLISAEHLIIPAETVPYDGYANMFRGCTNLTTGPEILATNLDNSYQMFLDCSSLNYIKCLATNIGSINNWTDGVAATGTFVKSTDMSNWPIGIHGIPEGWVVQSVSGSDNEPGGWVGPVTRMYTSSYVDYWSNGESRINSDESDWLWHEYSSDGILEMYAYYNELTTDMQEFIDNSSNHDLNRWHILNGLNNEFKGLLKNTFGSNCASSIKYISSKSELYVIPDEMGYNSGIQTTLNIWGNKNYDERYNGYIFDVSNNHISPEYFVAAENGGNKVVLGTPYTNKNYSTDMFAEFLPSVIFDYLDDFQNGNWDGSEANITSENIVIGIPQDKRYETYTYIYSSYWINEYWKCFDTYNYTQDQIIENLNGTQITSISCDNDYLYLYISNVSGINEGTYFAINLYNFNTAVLNVNGGDESSSSSNTYSSSSS